MTDTKDLVRRLRDWPWGKDAPTIQDAMNEAADAIERLSAPAEPPFMWPNPEGNYCAHHPDDPAHGPWCTHPTAPAPRELTTDEQKVMDAALMASVKRVAPAPECKCNLRTKLVGDGCEVCNPELAAELQGCNPKLQSNSAELLPEQALREAHAEIERLQSDLASTQVALNDWKVFHSTVRLEVEVERLRALLWESENALLDYVDRLEKQGGQMNYGRSVLARINAELGDKHDN